MSVVDRWLVDLSIVEGDDETRAEARLVMGNGGGWLGRGAARRHPRDPNVTEIGERIAAARALSDLAHLLLGEAAAELAGIIHERVDVHL
jgi:hypothetical protein